MGDDMRLIDADELVSIINYTAEKEGGMTKTMEYIIEMVNLMPSVTHEYDGIQMFRDYINLVGALNKAVEKCRGQLSIADIRGMEMLEEFEKIIQELQEKGYCKEEGSND